MRITAFWPLYLYCTIFDSLFNFIKVINWNMDNRNYSQITFEFSDVPSEQGNEASLGVRVKTLKTEPEPVKNEAPETTVEEPALAETVTETVTTPAKKSTRGRKSLILRMCTACPDPHTPRQLPRQICATGRKTGWMRSGSSECCAR